MHWVSSPKGRACHRCCFLRSKSILKATASSLTPLTIKRSYWMSSLHLSGLRSYITLTEISFRKSTFSGGKTRTYCGPSYPSWDHLSFSTMTFFTPKENTQMKVRRISLFHKGYSLFHYAWQDQDICGHQPKRSLGFRAHEYAFHSLRGGFLLWRQRHLLSRWE